MSIDLQFKQHPKQSEIDSLEEVHFEAHLLFRTVQNMLIKHGETQESLKLEQDLRKVLVDIRKMIKKTKAMDN